MRLVSWIGGNDLDAAEAKIDQPGAIAATLASASFAGLHLLYSYPEKRVANYLSWLSPQYDLPVAKRRAALASPIDFHDIYLAADALLADLTQASAEPIWAHFDQLSIQRTHECFCTAVFNLLRLATKNVVVIDAYGWTPEAIIQMQHLIRCVLNDRVSSKLPHITLFFKKNQRSPNAPHVKNEIFRGIDLIGNNVQIEVLELEDIPGNDVFHNCCILTEHGGVKTGHGIGVTGDQAHTDEAVLLNSDLYHKKWKQFMEDKCFNVVSQS